MRDRAFHDRFERRTGQVLLAGLLVASVCLTCGLLLWLASGGRTAAAGLLDAGLLLLMATPVLRVALAIAEYARERDWLFVATAGAVLAILAASVWYSFRAL